MGQPLSRGDPNFQTQRSRVSETGPFFILIICVAARVSRPASVIRVLIRRIQLGSSYSTCGILESPPWGRNEPTGHSGHLGRHHQVRGRKPCEHGMHRLRVSGSSEHSTDAIQIAPARGRAVHPMAAACCRPGPTGRPAGYCHTLQAAEYHSAGFISFLLQRN